MMRIRSLLSLTLALLVAFTSQQLAVARGQPMAAGTIELCVGTEVVIVPVDAEGNPTGPAHLCPDVAFAFLALTSLPLLDMARDIHISTVRYAGADQSETSLVHIEPQARGPPLFA